MSSGHQQFTGNINSFNTVNFITDIDAEGRQILQWLSPLEPQRRHQGVRTERLDGVGNWVLETKQFRRWCDTENGCIEPVLFCSGNPGVGKTYLSSLVIDRLCDQSVGKDIAVVGLYCDFLTQQEQSATSMLGAILKQLASRGGIPQHTREAFQRAKKEFGGRGLRLPDLVRILKKTIDSLPRVFICIDALDESAPKHRRDLLGSLQEIVRVSPGTRIFLTGRPHIEDEIVKWFSEVVRIPISPTQDDIKSYLEKRLEGDTDPSAMNDELREDIMRVVPEKISEIFLLVSLNIDAILGEVTVYKRRRKLEEITNGEGLGSAYAATLSRVKAQQRSRSKLGMEVLMWLPHSERPLHVNELCHALGVEEGYTDLNNQNIPTIETLLACSLGLVTVEKSSSTVRLIHYTLQEHLFQNPNLFLNPHSVIAEVCLTYLNFRHVRGFSTALRSVPSTAPFIEYASCCWGAHARRETTERVKALALKLLDGYVKHISSTMLLLRVGFGGRHSSRPEGRRPFTGLDAAAYFGCVEIIVALLEMNKGGTRATDLHGNTAITWAARGGHEGAVRILLERTDINPNTADTKNGRTPLSWAAEGGYEGVLRVLLERSDVNPNTVDTKYRGTPLSWAAWNGHEGIVRILLERNDVNPNAADSKYRRTPLSWAAENGYEGVVRTLLERSDINPNTVDTKYGGTPLSWAAGNGHEGVVRTLLERSDVDPNTADTKSGRTPLSWAAGNGHAEVVRTLLERNDAHPDITDTQSGRTPLSWAAENGHEGIVRMLLERNDVNPNTVDPQFVETPLSWAASKGREGVVRILLERDEVHPDAADTQTRRTPLSWAAGKGYVEVVRILLERNEVNPNAADTQTGRTPLSWAAGSGHVEAVGMLLERSDIHPDIADTQSGRTPLSWAAKNGHEGIVRMLLERNDVNPNTADTRFGGTPLSWAAGDGREGIVRILLERDEVNPNAAITQTGHTPLSSAARCGHEGVVRILLERNDVDPNTVDTKYGRTPLQWAVRNNYGRIANLLQERMDPIRRNAPSAQSAELVSAVSSDPSESPSKRTRRS